MRHRDEVNYPVDDQRVVSGLHLHGGRDGPEGGTGEPEERYLCRVLYSEYLRKGNGIEGCWL
jgi:hypothetical protein